MKSLVIFLLLIFAHQVVGQQENGEFYAIAEKIENLLRYKHKSTTQLKTLLVELKEYSAGNESSYDQIKRRVENVLFPIEIKLVHSDIYNRNYKHKTLSDKRYGCREVNQQARRVELC